MWPYSIKVLGIYLGKKVEAKKEEIKNVKFFIFYHIHYILLFFRPTFHSKTTDQAIKSLYLYRPLQLATNTLKAWPCMNQIPPFLWTVNPLRQISWSFRWTLLFLLCWDGMFLPSSTLLCFASVLSLVSFFQPYLLHISQILLCLRKLSAIFCPLAFSLAQCSVFSNTHAVLHFTQSTFLEARRDNYTHISFGSLGIF